MEDKILTKEEVASMLHVSASTISRVIREGKLPAHCPFGQKYYILLSDVLSFIRSSPTKAKSDNASSEGDSSEPSEPNDSEDPHPRASNEPDLPFLYEDLEGSEAEVYHAPIEKSSKLGETNAKASNELITSNNNDLIDRNDITNNGIMDGCIGAVDAECSSNGGFPQPTYSTMDEASRRYWAAAYDDDERPEHLREPQSAGNKTDRQSSNSYETTSNELKAEDKTAVTQGTKTKRGRPRQTYPDLVQAEEIVALWHEHCPELARVEKLTEARRRALGKTLHEWGSTREEQLSTAKALFKMVSESPFLLGREGSWRANFDWVVSGKGKTGLPNWLKVWEGNYKVSPLRNSHCGGMPHRSTVNDDIYNNLGW